MRKPNLFIVGAPRCGTTSVMNWLNEHPDIYFLASYEPHFFANDLADYKNNVSSTIYKRLFRKAKNEKWVGEKGAFYLYSNNAPRRIKTYSPDSKILIFLREPTDMFYSWHKLYFNDFYGKEDVQDPKKAFHMQEQREKESKNDIEKYFYKELFNYNKYVKRYIKIFGPENVRVIIFEDLKDKQQIVYDGITDFLKVKRFKPKFRIYNKSSKNAGSFRFLFMIFAKKLFPVIGSMKEVVPFSIRRGFREFIIGERDVKEINKRFRKHIRKETLKDIENLEKLIKRDLSIWKDDGGKDVQNKN